MALRESVALMTVSAAHVTTSKSTIMQVKRKPILALFSMAQSLCFSWVFSVYSLTWRNKQAIEEQLEEAAMARN